MDRFPVTKAALQRLRANLAVLLFIYATRIDKVYLAKLFSECLLKQGWTPPKREES